MPDSKKTLNVTTDMWHVSRAQGVWFQDKDCPDNASPYDSTSSRSQVAIGQMKDMAKDCVYATPEDTREMFYRNKACVGSRVSFDEFQLQKPLEFQARCMVVLIEEESRKALFDMLVAAGRVLDHPL